MQILCISENVVSLLSYNDDLEPRQLLIFMTDVSVLTYTDSPKSHKIQIQRNYLILQFKYRNNDDTSLPHISCV